MTIYDTGSNGYGEVGIAQGGPVEARLSYIRFARDV